MILSTMYARLRERVGNPSITTVTNDTLINRINEAYEDIWDRYRFHANRGTSSAIVTVVGTNTYTLPTTADVLWTVRDATNHILLQKIDRVTWDGLFQANNAKPTRYFRDGTSLYLDPIPDGVYTIQVRFKKSITLMAVDADTPAIPSSWHQGINLLARYKYYETNQDWNNATGAFSVWAGWVKDKTDEIDEEMFYAGDVTVSPSTLEVSLTRLDFDHSDD